MKNFKGRNDNQHPVLVKLSMPQIKLSELTLERIKNREFEKLIPEFYELEEIIENNDWHNNDSVLNHTISVL